jgi:hypothetical protein
MVSQPTKYKQIQRKRKTIAGTSVVRLDNSKAGRHNQKLLTKAIVSEHTGHSRATTLTGQLIETLTRDAVHGPEVMCGFMAKYPQLFLKFVMGSRHVNNPCVWDTIRTLDPKIYQRQFSVLKSKATRKQTIFKNLMVYLQYGVEFRVMKATLKQRMVRHRLGFEADVVNSKLVRVEDFNSDEVMLRAVDPSHQLFTLKLYQSKVCSNPVSSLMQRGPLLASDQTTVLSTTNAGRWHKPEQVLHYFNDDSSLKNYADQLAALPTITIPASIIGIILSYTCRNSPNQVYSTTYNYGTRLHTLKNRDLIYIP